MGLKGLMDCDYIWYWATERNVLKIYCK